MGVKNFLEKVFKVTGTNTETVVVNIPASIYYKELAIYTASSYLANAISMQSSKEIGKMRDKIKQSNFSNQLKEFEELTKPEKEEKDVSMQTFFNMFSM